MILSIALMFVYLIVHYFFLWQFDHNIAHFIWKTHPEAKEDYVDAWIIGELIFGRRYINNIDVYNSCMAALILAPILACFVFLRLAIGIIPQF